MTATRRLAGLALLLLTGATSGAFAEPPRADSVEPPSWWAGHTIDPVRLLIRGSGLGGARVASRTPALGIGLARVNERGTALFVDVHVAPDAPGGVHELRVLTADGEARVGFELLEPLAREGRYQGISPDDVIYLLMPDRFANGDPANDDPERSRGLHDRSLQGHYHGGDLQGVIDRLPYLADLGVTALWLNPVYDNVDRLNPLEVRDDGTVITGYHGYGAVDLYAVDEHLGDVALLRELVDAAHARGLKVIQDQVANHTGPDHPWVGDPPTPTWFNGSRESHAANTWQTWTLMDSRAVPELRRETLDGWFLDILPDLNQDDEEVSRYLIQNSLWWVGVTGLDAVRQDTLPYVPRRFWRDWTLALGREYPRLDVIGELFDGDPALVSYFQGGRVVDGIDTGIGLLFDFPSFFPLRRAFADAAPVRELAVMLARDHLYHAPERLVTFLGLHDVDRFMNAPAADTTGLRLAWTFLFTARGIPLIYYGDEIAMPGGADPDNRRDFPGGWPGDPRDAFEASGRTPAEREVFDHVRLLAALRRDRVELRRGPMSMLLAGEQTLAWSRTSGRAASIVALNNAPGEQSLRIDVSTLELDSGAVLRDALGLVEPVTVRGGAIELALPARSAAVLLAGTSEDRPASRDAEP